MTADRLISLAVVSEQLSISDDTARRLVQSGQLRAVNVGAGSTRPRWAVRAADLDAFLAGRSNSAAPAAKPRRHRTASIPNYFAGRGKM